MRLFSIPGGGLTQMRAWLLSTPFDLAWTIATIATPALVITDAANAGGFTATITDSTDGTTNTLYRRRVTGELDATGWTASGSRTGDGTISGTVAVAYYWWQVTSSIGTPATAPTLSVVDRQNGTGADVTITGSSGATVGIYAKVQEDDDWTLVGTITGDGMVSVNTARGYYWWYAAALTDPTAIEILTEGGVSLTTEDGTFLLIG